MRNAACTALFVKEQWLKTRLDTALQSQVKEYLTEEMSLAVSCGLVIPVVFIVAFADLKVPC